MNSFNGGSHGGPEEDILEHCLYLDAVGVYWDPDTDDAYSEDGEVIGNFVEVFGDEARAMDPESFGIMDENEFPDLEDIMFRFIRHKREYKECSAYEEPQCLAALSDAIMEEENLCHDAMKLVISYDDVNNMMELRGYHPVAGPVWSETTREVWFPTDYVLFSNAVLDISHHCEVIRNLTHGCHMCWRRFNVDPTQEIADEHGCDEDLVVDLREAQRENEVQGHGPIQPDCPVCMGSGIDAFGGIDTV